MLQAKLLSDFSFPAPMQMRQPPRIVPASLLKEVRQVEFVGYVANPKFRRGAPPGEATKAVAAMRNMRQQPKQATPKPLTLRARSAAWLNSCVCTVLVGTSPKMAVDLPILLPVAELEDVPVAVLEDRLHEQVNVYHHCTVCQKWQAQDSLADVVG